VTALPSLTSVNLSARAKSKSGADSVACSARDGAGRLVVVSNRVADLSAKCQSGGLAVAVAHALKGSRGLWFGWSGETSEDALSTPPNIEMRGELSMAKLDLLPEEEEGYYYGYANRCVWPALHYRLDLARCSEVDAETYFSVNARFADALMPLLEQGDTIWVHDYHLMARALDRALNMRRPERWARHRQLMQRIEAGNVGHWRDMFLNALGASSFGTAHYPKHNLGAA
jgi:trehalose-6-phosphate synthase